MRQALHWLTVIWLLDALVLWWFSDQPFFRVVTTTQGRQLSGSVATFFLGLSLICLIWSGWLHWHHPVSKS
ncbi:hypothetical protein [Levilactobacillus acidifarinae]|uniref:Uncharacterized protein n=1 Tax=Levilactobacillus acidifarinae DSM 19394 = JCM 15949 TaxID=1423715 RepID=A0A0R1LRG6_9LACO|nr:hypothetical protein [Levilactobacillus acidifarinae]KRK96195.1 hypothetical protein FD25_GL002661 [Levilactobacillus acidifarinae DSM 19394]GEO69556.1 hypothetical protein LAC03_14660 [Levilactobacillus acidifarinae]